MRDAVLLLFLLAAASGGASAERVDYYASDGTRQGYAIVNRESGRVDYFNAQSRRLGHGRITTDQHDAAGRRVIPSVPPPPAAYC